MSDTAPKPAEAPTLTQLAAWLGGAAVMLARVHNAPRAAQDIEAAIARLQNPEGQR